MYRIMIVSAVVLAGLIAALWISKHTEKCRIIREAICCLYIFGVLYFTLISRQPSGDNKVNLILFYSFYRSLKFIHPFRKVLYYVLTGRYDQVITTIKPLETAALNILLFIPLGYLFPLYSKKKNGILGKIILFSALCSICIEIVQTITNLGWFDVDDLFCNVVGTVIGYLVFTLVKYFICFGSKRNERKNHGHRGHLTSF